MKSEHRHELQTNELGKFTEKLGTFLEGHGNSLMIGICTVSIVASGIIYWVKTQNSKESVAWRDLASAMANNKPEDFKEVWESHKGTTTGLWARVHEGESRLALGVETLFRNADTGLDEVKKTREAFQTVVDDRSAPAEIRERALIGLGRALESMSEPGDAVKTYQTLLKEFPGSLYKKDAEERVAVLTKGSGQEFYAWFAKFPRKKEADKRPHDFGSELEDDAAIKEMIEKHKAKEGKGAKKGANDDIGSPTLPDDDAPGKDASEPKPDPVPVPESNSTDDKKPAAESKPDES